MPIVTSDWHLTDKSADVVFGELLPGIAKACAHHRESQAICLGDLFHIRYKVDAHLLNALRDQLKHHHDDLGITWRILPGNHDQYNVEGRNVLEVLDEIDGVTVFSEPAWDELGLWVPYRKHKEDLLEAFKLKDPLRKRVAKLALMHHGVVGSWMNDHMQCTSGLTDDELRVFDHVFTGHYHKHHTVGRTTYIGSPYQTRADESGQDKGYILLDGDGSWQFFPQRWGKRYHHFDLASIEQLSLEAISPRDEVRVKTAAGVDASQVARTLIAAGVKNHVVTPTQEVVETRMRVVENAPISKYAESYIDLHTEADGLDPKELRAAYTELTV